MDMHLDAVCRTPTLALAAATQTPMGWSQPWRVAGRSPLHQKRLLLLFVFGSFWHFLCTSVDVHARLVFWRMRWTSAPRRPGPARSPIKP